MSQRARVVVIGSSNTDMVVKSARIPAPGETVLGGEFVMTAGGKGANQAVAAARLGADVTFVARVGDDVFGEQAVASIADSGVRTDCIIRDPSATSGVALICVDARGQNSIVVAPGANGRLAPEDVESARAAFGSADLVVLQLEIPMDAVKRAISLARELGKPVVLNPAPAPDEPLPLEGVDVLTPNEVEAAMLLGRDPGAPFDPQQTAGELVSRLGVGAAVLTLGPRGAVAADASGVREVEGRRVTAVDTTAAGDCFTGALAVALAEGLSLADAAEFANAAAAISATRMGAQASMPLRADVERALSQTRTTVESMPR